MNLKTFWQCTTSYFLLTLLAISTELIYWSESATVLKGNAILSLYPSIILNILPSFRLCLALMTFSDISCYYYS